MAVQPGSRERRTCSELIRTSLSRLSLRWGTFRRRWSRVSFVQPSLDIGTQMPVLRHGSDNRNPGVASLGAGRGSG